jgi:hypothetical protein
MNVFRNRLSQMSGCRSGTAFVTALVCLLGACSEAPGGPRLQDGSNPLARNAAFDWSEWTEPVNLGPSVNTVSGDQNASLTRDGLDLYFVSNRPGTGGTDIWVSHRNCDSCSWRAPTLLDATINTAANEGAPSLSRDGHLLFFFSDRAGGLGNADLYVSSRSRTTEAGDWSPWGPAMNLGSDVNTAGIEQGVYLVPEKGNDPAVLYFNRTSTGTSIDIYLVVVSREGVPQATAQPVYELNDPVASDQKVAITHDGKELFMSTNRVGGLGLQDIWRSTRVDVGDPWSALTNAGGPLNTGNTDSQPTLSQDGKTMFFTSNRPGSVGGNDIWMTTRRPNPGGEGS